VFDEISHETASKANRRTAEYRMSKGGFARAAQALALRVAQSFFKIDRIHYSMFDVGRSMFNVQEFLFLI